MLKERQKYKNINKSINSISGSENSVEKNKGRQSDREEMWEERHCFQ